MAGESGMPLPAAWDRTALEAVGFRGFVPFAALAATGVPREPGIYVVLRTSTTRPEILELTRARAGSGTRCMTLRRDGSRGHPCCTSAKLRPRAGGLRKRLAQYARKGSSHAGGRSIWQLADQDELLVAWATTPGESAEDVEIRYRATFADVYKQWPFANRKR